MMSQTLQTSPMCLRTWYQVEVEIVGSALIFSMVINNVMSKKQFFKWKRNQFKLD